MVTIYLEPDDEITSAIARIRAAGGSEQILVVPPASKIATSRINFKLLTREAAERQMNLVAVSDEPQVRALAISAGLPAYDSIQTAEQALATFREQDRQLSQRIDRTMPRERKATDDGSQTRVLPPSHVARAAAAASVPVDTAVLPTQQAGARRPARRKRRIGIAPLLVLAFVVLLVAAVGYGAYVFLPTATVTVKPAAAPISVGPFVVTADPHVAVVDAGAGTIPAQTISVPVHVEATFPATGIDAHDVRATGTVTFKSENTVNPVSVPRNTVVSTADGIDFVTLDDIVLAQASFATGPTTADVDVRAVKGGTVGNVDANTITVVPADLKQAVVSVSNVAATSGGKHVEDQVVSQNDYDAALQSLSGQLEAALGPALTSSQAVPRGLTAFAPTAQMSAGQPDQPATSVVGTAASSFTLALDATADVTAVNESLIDQVAAARLTTALAPAQKLIDAYTDLSRDSGTVVNDTVVYSVRPTGMAYTNPDPATLVAAIRGKSIVDARAALASLGAADITVWPDFVDRLPDQAARISITVVAPTPGPASGPSFGPASGLPKATPTLLPPPSPAAS